MKLSWKGPFSWSSLFFFFSRPLHGNKSPGSRKHGAFISDLFFLGTLVHPKTAIVESSNKATSNKGTSRLLPRKNEEKPKQNLNPRADLLSLFVLQACPPKCPFPVRLGFVLVLYTPTAAPMHSHLGALFSAKAISVTTLPFVPLELQLPLNPQRINDIPCWIS